MAFCSYACARVCPLILVRSVLQGDRGQAARAHERHQVGHAHHIRQVPGQAGPLPGRRDREGRRVVTGRYATVTPEHDHETYTQDHFRLNTWSVRGCGFADEALTHVLELSSMAHLETALRIADSLWMRIQSSSVWSACPCPRCLQGWFVQYIDRAYLKRKEELDKQVGCTPTHRLGP